MTFQNVSAVLILVANIIAILVSFRCSLKENLRMIGACAVIYAMIRIYLSLTGDPIGLFMIIPTGVWFLFSLYFIRSGSISQKVFVTFSVLSITTLLYIAASFAATAIFGYGGTAFEIGRLCGLTLLLTVYVITMTRWGKPLLTKVFSSIEQRKWWLYVLYPTVHYLVLRQLYDYYLAPPEDSFARALFYALPLFAAAGYALIFALTVFAHDKAQATLERDMARQTLSIGREYYENLTGTLEQVRLLQHDYKHQLAALSNLAHEGSRREDALRHLDSMIQRYEDGETESFAANPVLDAVLRHYAEQIRASGVSFTARVALPREVNIDNYDLCVVLGNLLDNAQSAAGALPEDTERFVKLDMRYKAPQVVIHVSNSYGRDITQNEQGQLVSSRADGGNGTRSVRAVAEKYGGVYENEWEDGIFSAYVLLGK